jgi:hypothetical protein
VLPGAYYFTAILCIPTLANPREKSHVEGTQRVRNLDEAGDAE